MAKKASGKTDPNNALICKNKRAKTKLIADEHLEAGLMLLGTEVKSCRAGKVQLNEAYIGIKGHEAYLFSAHIAEYPQANRFNHEPERPRKLLLHRRELDRLIIKLSREGQTALPFSMYFKNGRVKIDIGVGRGQKTIDRRERIKERDVERNLRQAMHRRR